MKPVLRIAITFLAVFLASFLHAQERPNIIWLMAEDMSLDLECYGMEAVKTPHLNKLAEEGMRFTNCFTTAPICSPSRSAMMTGVHQLKINAHHHRSNRDLPLPEPFKPFTYWLREAGYTCVLGSPLVMGKGRKTDCNFKHTALGPWDGKDHFGLFDRYDELPGGDQPFFAQVQLSVTHRGDWWDDVRAKSSHPVDPASVQLPPYIADDSVTRLDWAKYLDQVEYMDHEVGLIINDLKKKGLYDNTVIIFMGDNGRCNIRGKGYLHDSGVHVPLIVHWPAGIAGGQVRDEIISATDITAAILDLAGAEIPSYMTGRSFMEKDFQRDYVFSSRDLWDEIMDKSRSISSSRYKYIRNDMPFVPWDAHLAYMEFYRPALHIMRKLYLKGQLNEHEKLFFAKEKPAEELYDLVNDPYELENLAGKQQYGTVLREMRAGLEKMEKRLEPVSTVYHPVFPESVRVLDWVRYFYPEDYLRMLEGAEIGYGKYARLYRDKK